MPGGVICCSHEHGSARRWPKHATVADAEAAPTSALRSMPRVTTLRRASIGGELDAVLARERLERLGLDQRELLAGAPGRGEAPAAAGVAIALDADAGGEARRAWSASMRRGRARARGRAPSTTPATRPSGDVAARGSSGASTQPSRTGAPGGRAGAGRRPDEAGRRAGHDDERLGRPAAGALHAREPPVAPLEGLGVRDGHEAEVARREPPADGLERIAPDRAGDVVDRHLEDAREAGRQRARGERGSRALRAASTRARPPLVHADDRALGVLDRVRQRDERRLGRRHEPVDAGRTEGRAGSVQPQCAQELAPEVAVVAGDVPSLLQPGRP